jgi:hypothetical protein
VDLWEIVVILVGSNAFAAAIMLALRGKVPPESHFRDSQLAAGALAVTGTVYAVLVGFVFLLAFQSYETARSSSQDEAVAAIGLFHVADQLPAEDRDVLQRDVVCYARSVIHVEWPAMADERSSPLVEDWASQAARGFERARLQGAVASGAEQSWFTATDTLQRGRRGRLAEASNFVPAAIWLLLIAAGVMVIGYVFLFADRRERRLPQWMMITAVTTAVTASLLMVAYLNHPYGSHEGSIEPSAMRDVLTTMERERGRSTIPPSSRCDLSGRPLSAIADRGVSG